jgi:hypothetical protein
MVERMQAKFYLSTSSFPQYLATENIFLIKNGLDTSLLRYQALVQKEPAYRLCLMRPAKVSQPSGAKTDQRDEASAEQNNGCR